MRKSDRKNIRRFIEGLYLRQPSKNSLVSLAMMRMKITSSLHYTKPAKTAGWSRAPRLPPLLAC